VAGNEGRKARNRFGKRLLSQSQSGHTSLKNEVLMRGVSQHCLPHPKVAA
jgi:hypothetical protein